MSDTVTAQQMVATALNHSECYNLTVQGDTIRAHFREIEIEIEIEEPPIGPALLVVPIDFPIKSFGEIGERLITKLRQLLKPFEPIKLAELDGKFRLQSELPEDTDALRRVVQDLATISYLLLHGAHALIDEFFV